jgi:hypothetical protein
LDPGNVLGKRGYLGCFNEYNWEARLSFGCLVAPWYYPILKVCLKNAGRYFVLQETYLQ